MQGVSQKYMIELHIKRTFCAQVNAKTCTGKVETKLGVK
jgi:hypothetical protein